MNGTEALHACGIQSFDGTNPQLQVGINRILHQHGLVDTLKRIGQRLHRKRVGTGAGTNPKNVDIVLQCQFDMLWRCHLGSHIHTRLLLHALKPGQRNLTITLKATGLGARFPDACTEVVAAQLFQLHGSGHHLFLGLSRARSCNHERTFVVGRQIQFL